MRRTAESKNVAWLILKKMPWVYAKMANWQKSFWRKGLKQGLKWKRSGFLCAISLSREVQLFQQVCFDCISLTKTEQTERKKNKDIHIVYIQLYLHHTCFHSDWLIILFWTWKGKYRQINVRDNNKQEQIVLNAFVCNIYLQKDINTRMSLRILLKTDNIYVYLVFWGKINKCIFFPLSILHSYEKHGPG